MRGDRARVQILRDHFKIPAGAEFWWGELNCSFCFALGSLEDTLVIKGKRAYVVTVCHSNKTTKRSEWVPEDDAEHREGCECELCALSEKEIGNETCGTCGFDHEYDLPLLPSDAREYAMQLHIEAEEIE